MITPRKVATLGIGFGVAAIAAIGFISDVEIPVLPSTPPAYSHGGGVDTVRNKPHYQITQMDDDSHVVHVDMQEEDDEETVIAFLLLELVEQGIIG